MPNQGGISDQKRIVHSFPTPPNSLSSVISLKGALTDRGATNIWGGRHLQRGTLHFLIFLSKQISPDICIPSSNLGQRKQSCQNNICSFRQRFFFSFFLWAHNWLCCSHSVLILFLYYHNWCEVFPNLLCFDVPIKSPTSIAFCIPVPSCFTVLLLWS